MNRPMLVRFSVVIFWVGMLALSGLSFAQSENRQGRLDVGIRQLYGNRNSAKFLEYRDIPQGFFIRYGELSLDELRNKTFFFHFQARDLLEKDQTYLLSLGAYRKYRLDLKWDQTPHVFTTTARSFLIETAPGEFIAPDPIQSVLRANSTNVAVLQSVLGSSPLVDMSLRRDKGSGSLSVTPTLDWAARLFYSLDKMRGYRPFGTVSNGFTNIIELPEPIDYRTHLLEAAAEYMHAGWNFQSRFDSSFFDNRIGTLAWDVPFPVSGNSTTRGRLDLYPSNRAQNFTFAGAFNAPHQTRLMASVVPGWMRQNDPFIPLTINPLLTGLPELPASSLHGSKQTLAMNYTITNEAIPKLPLTLRYTSYDYNNNTPSLTFPLVVITDSSTAGPETSEPFDYHRKNLAFDASWQLFRNSSLSFLYDWERFDRRHREAAQSTENAVGAAADFSPYGWLMLHASYRHGDRSPGNYDGGDLNLPSLRKYDEGARTRHRAEALTEITPLEAWSFTASYGTTQDGYQEKGCIWLGYDQCYGLLKDVSYNYSFDVTYDLTDQVLLYAAYTKEKYKYRQLSRQRNPAAGTVPANDSPNNDWEASRRDQVDTYTAGLNISPTPRAVIDLYYNLSAAINKLMTRALGVPGAAGTPAFLPVTAPPFPGVSDYPDTSNRWHQLDASVKFPLLSGNLTPKLEYRFEKYDRVDFQLASVGRYFTDPQLTNSLFLGVGADIPGYNAHIISASLEYRF